MSHREALRVMESYQHHFIYANRELGWLTTMSCHLAIWLNYSVGAIHAIASLWSCPPAKSLVCYSSFLPLIRG